MDRETAKNMVKDRLDEYLTGKGINTRKAFTCLNPLHVDTDPSMRYDPKRKKVHCFGCGKSYDTFDLIGLDYNLTDPKEIFNKAYEIFHITLDAPAAVKSTERKTDKDLPIAPEKNGVQSDVATAEPEADFTDYYKACRQSIGNEAAQSYLAFRGISKETADRFYIGFDEKTGFIVIPATKGFYIARNTDPAAKFRYKNPAGAASEIFNEKAIYGENGKPVFITEGAIDALSIIETGRAAAALNSTSNVQKLLNKLEQKKTRSPLILCLDSDDAGKEATAKLEKGLREIGIQYIKAEISGRYKDPNEAYTQNKVGFFADVAQAERDACKPDNTTDYIYSVMPADINQIKAQANRKTGFANLDAEIGNIYNGLYVIGALSGGGKTTFAGQIADQMAAQGHHVLFFSMEQSRLEMVSKSIARETAKRDAKTAVTSLQIRQGAMNEAIADAAMNYCEAVGDRVSVIEYRLGCTVTEIKDYALRYKERNGVNPVCIIDYLQALQAEAEPGTNRKQTEKRAIVDYNVTELRRLTFEGIPVILISSLNRSNYYSKIGLDAFKESGGIEYTADCVFGLQLAVMESDIFDKDGREPEKKKLIEAASNENPRKLELVCLKNRYGKKDCKVHFNYYPQFDFYEPDDGFTDYTGATPWGKATKKL